MCGLREVVQVELLQQIFFIDDLVLVMNCTECCKKFFLYKYREIFTTVSQKQRFAKLGDFYFGLANLVASISFYSVYAKSKVKVDFVSFVSR